MELANTFADVAMVFLTEMMDGQDLEMVVDNSKSLKYKPGKWDKDFLFELCINARNITLICPDDKRRVWNFLQKRWDKGFDEYQIRLLRYVDKTTGFTHYVAVWPHLFNGE